MEKDKNVLELTVKFTKILAEFVNQTRMNGFRHDLPKSVVSYLSDNIEDFMNSLSSREIELLDLESVLYKAAEKTSKDDEIFRIARLSKFIPNDSRLSLKYKILAYLRDSKRELERNDWKGASGEMVDEMMSNKKSKCSPVRSDRSNLVKINGEFPNQEDARAKGGLYLPKMICISKSGVGLVQFNYDLSSLIKDEDEED